MAGGKGTRFWPLSTEEKPKQFINLLGEETMLQMTVNRLLPLIPIERIFIVTGSRYIHYVKEQLPNLPEKNIIVEPEGRNTAPCIALSAFYIDKIYKDAEIAVLPSDHLIKDEKEYRDILKAGYDFVRENKDSIVTIGIKPDRPETGYGYIKVSTDEKKLEADNIDIYAVNRFVEKPNKEKAKIYLKEGNYLWNAGMFIWKTSTILKHTKDFLPSTYNVLEEIAAASDEGYKDTLNEKYPLAESISVDFGIMEKAEDIYVIPGSFGWDDIGSWKAVERYRQKDENDNICVGGKVINIDGRNNIAVSNGKPIIIAGINDAFVIESDEAIVITNKENIGNISSIRSSLIGGYCK
jgi:mannose-1-phosphate guanylyltransferase